MSCHLPSNPDVKFRQGGGFVVSQHIRRQGVRPYRGIDTNNLDDMAWEERLCGGSQDTKAYRIYNPETHKVMESRNVIFVEPPSQRVPPQLQLNVTTLHRSYTPPARNWPRSCQGFANASTVARKKDTCHTLHNSLRAGNR